MAKAPRFGYQGVSVFKYLFLDKAMLEAFWACFQMKSRAIKYRAGPALFSPRGPPGRHPSSTDSWIQEVTWWDHFHSFLVPLSCDRQAIGHI